MSIKRQNDVEISTISTFRMGGKAKEMATVENEKDIEQLFAEMPENEKWFVIGGGSNVVFPDGDSDILLIRLAPAEIRIENVNDDEVSLIVPAGVVWDDVVAFAVAHGFAGIEALSAIPGTAGATPIQNVGAYGTETSDVLVSVRAYDTLLKKFVVFSNAECKFSYRDSMFKQIKHRYVITEVTYRLYRDEPNVPQYQGLAEYFAERDISRPSLLDIRNAIIHIRANKLPDPKEIASVGSFFKNAFVPNAHAAALKEKFPKLAVFPVDEKISKIGAGSLIDVLGYKGKKFGNLSVYKNNALVLVNDGGATRAELSELVAKIVSDVKETFEIALEPEPELL